MKQNVVGVDCTELSHQAKINCKLCCYCYGFVTGYISHTQQLKTDGLLGRCSWEFLIFLQFYDLQELKELIE